MEYTAQTFTISSLDGFSQKSIEEHLGLYQGYVKNFNAISAAIGTYTKDYDANTHAVHELIRRRSFEFDGMRLHELYFAQFDGGASTLAPESELGRALATDYRSVENFQKALTHIGSARGPGWAILYFDPIAKQFLTGFSGEQHQGHFVTLPIILALDVWEHAFLLDHGALGKAKYIDAFFKNLNWGVVEKRFAAAIK